MDRSDSSGAALASAVDVVHEGVPIGDALCAPGTRAYVVSPLFGEDASRVEPVVVLGRHRGRVPAAGTELVSRPVVRRAVPGGSEDVVVMPRCVHSSEAAALDALSGLCWTK
jgi:hypothetical protein